MNAKQRVCAVTIWATSAMGIGGLLDQFGLLPYAVNCGLGGLLALVFIIEAGRR